MKQVSASTIELTKVKWNEMFDSEEELIETMKKIDIKKFENNYYKGYAYIGSFQKQLANGAELSPKQITQLKRLAKEVYKYHFGY